MEQLRSANLPENILTRNTPLTVNGHDVVPNVVLLSSNFKTVIMHPTNLSAAAIAQAGLIETDNTINASVNKESRVFKYPRLENVYIMESDLYGNPMPADSCYLAFTGRNGLMGKQITINLLTKTNVEGIKKIVASNMEG